MNFQFPEGTFPRGQLDWTAADGAGHTMAFDFNRESRIIIQGLVDGEAATLLLDSGMEVSVISSELFSRLGRTSSGDMPFIDRGAVSKLVLTSGIEFVLPMVRLHGLTVGVLDLKPMSAMIGLKIDALLGREIFEDAVVEIDFPRRLLGLAPTGELPEGEWASIPLRRFNAGRGRTIPLTLETYEPVELEFDLGSANPLVLQSSYWKAAGLHVGRRASDSLIGGAHGIRRTGLINLKNVAIGAINLTEVDALLEQPAAGIEARLGNGIVGIPILSRFRIATDYPNSVLYIHSPAAEQQLRLPKNRSGLRVIQEGSYLRILLVAKNSPAAKAGWKAGELIALVNGRPIDDRYWKSNFWRWAEAPAGTSIALTMSDRSIRRLTLNDYY